MKPHFKQIVIVILSIFLLSCSSDDSASKTPVTPILPVTPPATQVPTTPINNSIKYLALGDSYTIGQSVCETCRFPEQLKSNLKAIYPQTDFSLKIIATTGWTTSNLISAINTQNPDSNYDLVTLLIGVNNQFQRMDFSVYQKEFPELLTKAISLAKGDKKNVIVLSIPDYAYTPFAANYSEANRMKISNELDQYNTFAENTCINKGVVFISITDITRQGLSNSNLVASDGLHPSELAYKMFIGRIFPQVKMILQD
ncbi:SGNH/GDSL hydrolase family protein [Flavobacterium hibernum]|uniref:Lysophospholipase n=1 Tax=Flavobacterium hibernum TaxID=37752 RepID=A0A0D0EXY0_9FLAO|nr:SGNH/GDSL hydrolase family protein [Flavobacterium hibernum]KIO53928.1 lysophospholipase [Flavobacterium hibernum]OXA83795.1 lysophospholipase [Flavobacterium hibernum]STO14728.1 GDSL-like Lipase/Acylhydrolase [Flavobacterium hibernum]